MEDHDNDENDDDDYDNEHNDEDQNCHNWAKKAITQTIPKLGGPNFAWYKI